MKPKPYRAAIKFEDKQITFEGPKDFVESMVAKYTLTSKPQAKPGDAEYISDSTISAGGGNERDLVAAKRPRGHHETVAVLAFALTQAGKPEFTDEDVHRAY